MRFAGVAVGLLVALTAAAAPPPPSPAVDPETLLKAINFGLLGKDASAYAWKSRPDCVVVYVADLPGFHSVEVLYLNRIDASRIRLKPYTLSYPTGIVEHYVSVELHGEETIREYTTETKDDATGQVVPTHESPTEWAFARQTLEYDRMVRAWKYIYAHGCRSAKSSF